MASAASQNTNTAPTQQRPDHALQAPTATAAHPRTQLPEHDHLRRTGTRATTHSPRSQTLSDHDEALPVGWVGVCGCAGAASLVGWLAPAPGVVVRLFGWWWCGWTLVPVVSAGTPLVVDAERRDPFGQ